MSFGFFVNFEGAEVATARCFVQCNIGCRTMLPVLDEGAEVLYPLFSTSFVCGLMVRLEWIRASIARNYIPGDE